MPWRKTDWDNWRSRRFKKACENAGLDRFRPYDLRHTCASLMIRAGDPPAEIAAHLGNSLRVLFDTYGHEIEEMRGQPVKSVDEVIRAARADDVRSVFGASAG